MHNDNDLNYRLAELLLRDKLKPTDIAKNLNREFPGALMTREKVYPRLAVALEQGFVQLHPPLEGELAERIEKKFRCKPGSVRVVACPMPGSNEAVSHAAADWAIELAKDIARSTRESSIWIGLGPGGATRDFAARFSRHLQADLMAPKVNLLAITAGGPADQPQYAPVSFFNLFPQATVDLQIGFFAETFMPASDFDRLRDDPPLGMKEAFEAKPRTRMLITSMGDFRDPHSLFRVFHEQSRALRRYKNLPKWWEHCVADVQYRPFSEAAPIVEAPTDLRAATLFELGELVTMSQQVDTQVILIARPCGVCDPCANRARALLPILKHKNLRVFSKLVMDSGTARELLQTPLAERAA